MGDHGEVALCDSLGDTKFQGKLEGTQWAKEMVRYSRVDEEDKKINNEREQ